MTDALLMPVASPHFVPGRKTRYALRQRRYGTLGQWAVRVLWAACLVMAVVVLGQYARTFFKIEHVYIDVRRAQQPVLPNDYRLDVTALQQIIPLSVQDSFWDIDPNQVRDALLRMPWVHDATVRLMLPNTVLMHVDEQVPVAVQVSEQGQAFLLSSNGSIIGPASERDAQLPHVFGVGSDRIVRPSEQALVQALNNFSVKTLVRVGQRRWSVLLSNGVVVRLPEHNADQAVQRLQQLERDYKLTQRAVRVIDLRTAGRVYVQLESGTAL